MLNINWTREENSNYKFPDIKIYNILKNGIIDGYEAQPDEGYVMYDKTDENRKQDNPDSEPYSVIYYYTLAGFPIDYDFDSFPWVAVLRSEIDENYISG